MQMLWLCGDERVRCRPCKSGIRANISAAEKAMTARHLKYMRFFILKTHLKNRGLLTYKLLDIS
jgi:hypothetical protein